LNVYYAIITHIWLSGRPGTNFVSSSITSDDSGTKSSHLSGTIPDTPSNPQNTGVSGGSSILTRTGGSSSGLSTGSTLSGTSSGNSGLGTGSTLSGTSSGNSGLGGGGSSTSYLSGTNSNNNGGNVVGILSRTGPSGTQHTIITPSNQQSVLGRFGGSQPVVYNSAPGTGIGSVASVPGSSSGAFAGPNGAIAGSFSDPSLDYH
jgi:hypothetical protein